MADSRVPRRSKNGAASPSTRDAVAGFLVTWILGAGYAVTSRLASGVFGAGMMSMGPRGHSMMSAASDPNLEPLLTGRHAWWIVPLALAAGGAVAARRRWPAASFLGMVTLAGCYLFLGGPTPAVIIPLALTLYTFVRSRPPVAWAISAALMIPMFWARYWRTPDLGVGDPGLYETVLLGIAWIVLPALVGLLRTGRLAALAHDRELELRRVAYEERLRVARDIHDIVGHSLSMISLQSGVALHLLDSDPAQARASLEAIRDASKGSLAELRQTLGVFRAPTEAEPRVPTPSLAGVVALVESVRAGGRTVRLSPLPDADGVPASVQAVAYRVVQEGLTNAVRHAPMASVTVSLERRPDALVVGVRDDGPGGTLTEGTGLRGMRERVEALGGTLAVGSRAGGGHSIVAVLPMTDSPADAASSDPLAPEFPPWEGAP